MPAVTRRQFLGMSALATLGTLFAAPGMPGNGLVSRMLAITATPTVTPLAPAIKSMRGLYAVLPRNLDAIPDDLLKSDLITGITLPITWSLLQPTAKDVTLDVIEATLNRVAAASKKLALRPLTGTGTPAWLFRDLNARKFTFTPASDLYHPLEFGKEVSLPYPWDKLMLNTWADMVTILGQRFDTHPALSRIAVSGPSYQQAEMYLPHTDDVMADWIKAGFTLTAMQAAWQKMLDTYAVAFLQTPFTLDLNPLPDPLDKSGQTLNGLVPISIAQYGLRRYPGRFFPAESDFSDVYPWLPAPLPGPKTQPALYLSYEKQQIPIYQFLTTAAKVTQIGLSVNEKRVSRNSDRVQATMTRANGLKPAYVEVPADWVRDPNNAAALRTWFTL